MYAANQCWNMFENIQNSVLRHLGHHLVTMDQVELWDLYWVCMMMIATWDVSVSITCVASSLANQTLSACKTMLQVCKRRFVTLMHDHLPHLVRVMYISVCILIYSFVVWCYMPWTLIKKCVVWLHQWRCFTGIIQVQLSAVALKYLRCLILRWLKSFQTTCMGIQDTFITIVENIISTPPKTVRSV